VKQLTPKRKQIVFLTRLKGVKGLFFRFLLQQGKHTLFLPPQVMLMFDAQGMKQGTSGLPAVCNTRPGVPTLVKTPGCELDQSTGQKFFLCPSLRHDLVPLLVTLHFGGLGPFEGVGVHQPCQTQVFLMQPRQDRTVFPPPCHALLLCRSNMAAQYTFDQTQTQTVVLFLFDCPRHFKLPGQPSVAQLLHLPGLAFSNQIPCHMFSSQQKRGGGSAPSSPTMSNSALLTGHSGRGQHTKDFFVALERTAPSLKHCLIHVVCPFHGGLLKLVDRAADLLDRVQPMLKPRLQDLFGMFGIDSEQDTSSRFLSLLFFFGRKFTNSTEINVVDEFMKTSFAGHHLVVFLLHQVSRADVEQHCFHMGLVFGESFPLLHDTRMSGMQSSSVHPFCSFSLCHLLGHVFFPGVITRFQQVLQPFLLHDQQCMFNMLFRSATA